VRIALLIALTPVMLGAAITDVEQRLIPNALIAVMIPLATAWRWYNGDSFVTGLALGAAVLGGGFALSAAGRRRKAPLSLMIGAGDVKLFAIAAVSLPLGPFLLFLIVTGLLGLIFGAFWLWRTGEGRFPLAPAAMLALWGLMTVPLRV
jgi:Flp pilus assembly protein protease CpaA